MKDRRKLPLPSLLVASPSCAVKPIRLSPPNKSDQSNPFLFPPLSPYFAIVSVPLLMIVVLLVLCLFFCAAGSARVLGLLYRLKSVASQEHQMRSGSSPRILVLACAAHPLFLPFQTFSPHFLLRIQTWDLIARRPGRSEGSVRVPAADNMRRDINGAFCLPGGGGKMRGAWNLTRTPG